MLKKKKKKLLIFLYSNRSHNRKGGGVPALLKAHIKHTQTHGNLHSGCLTLGSDFSIYISYNDVRCREQSQCTVLHCHFTIVKKLRINIRNIHVFEYTVNEWFGFRTKTTARHSFFPLLLHSVFILPVHSPNHSGSAEYVPEA